jgi:multidrug efflux pump subunit AcrA (membrane-fusion protein)
MSASDRNAAIEPTGLATLLFLARRARAARLPAELAFIAVNETYQLCPYRQAALWWPGQGVTALSGVSAPERNAPYVQWLAGLAQALAARPEAVAGVIDPGGLPADTAHAWNEWWPRHAVWIPLLRAAESAVDPGPAVAGGWLFAREEAWRAGEVDLLSEWAETWLHAWQGQEAARAPRGWRHWAAACTPRHLPSTIASLWRKPARRIAVLAALGLCIPVRLTVLAPAELVPAQPAVIRAPIDGVVDGVLVQPNQRVQAGQPLFTLERSALNARQAIAAQALATARAEYRQHAQQALFDTRSKARLALLQSTIAERESDITYLQQQIARATLSAPHAGIALFDAPSDWVGRPVATGERIATVAVETDQEVEAWLAPGDMIALSAGAPVTFYLNSSPLRPMPATVRYINHTAEQRPDGSFAYRLRAALAPDADSARIGLKGSAKVSGDTVPLAYWILRRPLAFLRQFVGL